ncbi:hypothetical protein [Streptomyces flavidovirens]|nr:hypothetical protein [Streptomyces flavidovirens]
MRERVLLELGLPLLDIREVQPCVFGGMERGSSALDHETVVRQRHPSARV